MAHTNTFTSNHVPKMREDLQERQVKVNADGDRNRYFLCSTTNSAFGVGALRKLVDKGELDMVILGSGDVMVKFTYPVKCKTVGEIIAEEKTALRRG
jgi:hypothetical protein